MEELALTIRENDITSSLCQNCGACCRITLSLHNTDTRYRRFLRQVGFTLIPPVTIGHVDCCDKVHDVRVDMGDCRHLKVTEDGGSIRYACKIYGTPSFPDLCGQYNCVSWAKVGNVYNLKNDTLRRAQVALNAATNKQTAPSSDLRVEATECQEDQHA